MLIGTFGIVPLSVHTVPTQVVALAFMIPLGVGIALAIRMGSTLPRSVELAKAIVFWTYTCGTAMFSGMTLLMWIFRHQIFALFTHEPDVIEGCNRIWWKVEVFFFLMSIFGLNVGVATGLGMQWTLGVVTVISLWIVGLPCIYYFSAFLGGGIDSAWSWMLPPYIAMNIVLMISFFRSDWHQIQNDIRAREGLKDVDDIVNAGDIESSDTIYGSTSERRVEEYKQLLNN